MPRQVLITGGAGFIGSHLADELLARGHRVRVLDSLIAQVHGAQVHGGENGHGARPAYLSPEVELIHGDVRDPLAVRRALDGVDAVYHYAAMVGVGQSMYQIDDYVGVNDLGTAVLLQALIERPVERLVVASSMSIYGEGLYHDPDGNAVAQAVRTPAQLRDGDWEPRGADGRPLVPVATPESKQPCLASVYALSKYVQERICLIVGQTYGMKTTALRFFNVYGPRQALSNPYTGVLAIFAARLLNGKPPMIFEDGMQRRDFVHVRDIARAGALCLERPEADGLALNIGSGHALSVRDIAARLAGAMGRQDIAPEISGRSRAGDIRHCFADISQARAVLGYEPQVTLDEGMAELVEWLGRQAAEDRVEQATSELAKRGLVA